MSAPFFQPPGLPAGPADFGGGTLPSGTIDFGVGEATKSFTVMVAGDTRYERDERFLVEVAGDSIRPAMAAATILDDDVALAISPASLRVPEGNAGASPTTFTVTRSGPLGGATSVAWAVAGSGANPAGAADFAGATLPAGTLSFAVGERVKTIVVSIAGDTTFEEDETFVVSLSAAAGVDIVKAGHCHQA